jgi:hypothetical protein
MTVYMKDVHTGIIDSLYNWTEAYRKDDKPPENCPGYLYEMFCSGGEDLVEVRRNLLGEWEEVR